MGRWMVARVQALRVYRAVARALIGSRVRYTITQVGSGSTSRVWVITARLAGVSCGSAALRISEDDGSSWAGCWLSDLRVRHIFRGAGIGEQLVRRRLALAAQQGVVVAHLLVFENNTVAITLFRKLGFRPADLPVLDVLLADEAQYTGRRRILMSVDLS